MAVKIKLKRMGKIREPYYRIVVADARTKRDGRAIEEIGKYHPKAEPSLIEVNSDRAQHWLSVGAQPTDPVRKLLEITGDWQRFKGLPGAEGTLKVAAPRGDKKAVFAAALAETLADSASAPKGKARAPGLATPRPPRASRATASRATARPVTARPVTARPVTARRRSRPGQPRQKLPRQKLPSPRLPSPRPPSPRPPRQRPARQRPASLRPPSPRRAGLRPPSPRSAGPRPPSLRPPSLRPPSPRRAGLRPPSLRAAGPRRQA